MREGEGTVLTELENWTIRLKHVIENLEEENDKMALGLLKGIYKEIRKRAEEEISNG